MSNKPIKRNKKLDLLEARLRRLDDVMLGLRVPEAFIMGIRLANANAYPSNGLNKSLDLALRAIKDAQEALSSTYRREQDLWNAGWQK